MVDKREMTTKIFSLPVVKRFLIIFLPSLALVGSIVMVLFSMEKKTNRLIIENKEVQNVNLQKKIISTDLRSIVSDVVILSGHHEIKDFLSGESDDLKNLAEEFLFFSQTKGVYDQVRLLDENGTELLRVD